MIYFVFFWNTNEEEIYVDASLKSSLCKIINIIPENDVVSSCNCLRDFIFSDSRMYEQLFATIKQDSGPAN